MDDYVFFSSKKGDKMIKNSLKDFNYDYKEHKKYVTKNHVSDINGIIRRKWRLYLQGIVLSRQSEIRDKEQSLILKKKY